MHFSSAARTRVTHGTPTADRKNGATARLPVVRSREVTTPTFAVRSEHKIFAAARPRIVDRRPLGFVLLAADPMSVAVERMTAARPLAGVARRPLSGRDRTVMAASKYPLGTVVQSKNPVTSKLEIDVREKLVAAGLSVHKGRSAIQCGHEASRDNYPRITPDILISHTKVCVEVDPKFIHEFKEVEDRTRNELLTGAGWNVVRLRLGGVPALGAYDVVAEAEAITKEVIAALVETIDDAIAGRPGTIRHIENKRAPRDPTKRSKLGALSPHKYFENAHYATWATPNGPERLVLLASGAYLGSDSQEGLSFICDVGLDQVPRNQWRDRLTEIMEELQAKDDGFEPVSRFPWGDSFFTGDAAGSVYLNRKFNPGADRWQVTTNLDTATSWTGHAISSDDAVLLALHGGAVELGWHITEFSAQSGIHGRYQKLTLERAAGTEV